MYNQPTNPADIHVRDIDLAVILHTTVWIDRQIGEENFIKMALNLVSDLKPILGEEEIPCAVSSVQHPVHSHI